MKNKNIIVRMCGIIALAVLSSVTTQSQAAKILVSGNSMSASNANLTGAIAGLGHQATFIAHQDFAATSLAGFDAVWLDGFSQYGAGNWPADLVAFMNGGGNVFVQNPGFGSEGLSTYPLGSQLSIIFTYPPGQDTIAIVDTGSPPGANHAVNWGVDDAGLSNWNVSAYGYFSSIGGFTGLTNTGTAGQWVTIATQVGAGYLVYTQQGVSQFLSSAGNPGAGSAAARFLDNVVTLNAVPEPSSVSLFLLDCGLMGLAGARRGRR